MTMFKKKTTRKSSKKDIDRLTIVVENGWTHIEWEISNHELFVFLMWWVPQMWKALIEKIDWWNITKSALTMFLISKLETLAHKYLKEENDSDSDDD